MFSTDTDVKAEGGPIRDTACSEMPTTVPQDCCALKPLLGLADIQQIRLRPSPEGGHSHRKG